MHFDMRRIEIAQFSVLKFLGHGSPDNVDGTAFGAAVKPGVGTLPFAKHCWQGSPADTLMHDIKNASNDVDQIKTLASAPLGFKFPQGRNNHLADSKIILL